MKKRILSILLTLCMVLCLVPTAAFAADGTEAIQPGASAQSILKIDRSRLSFAGHEWWVIGKKTDESNNAPIITLLAVNNDFGDVPFRTGSAVPFENARRYSEDNSYYANNPSNMSQWRKPNEYAGSTLQQKMVSLAEAIPEKEQAVIRPKDITEGITGQEVKAQKLWTLSHEDSMFLYRNSCTYAAQWWTRSSNEVYGYGSWTIHPDGRSGSALNVDYDAAVRPAMEMDLSSVLFISAAEHGKVADLTTPIAEYAGDEWKLTLHDSDRDDFTAKTVLVNGSVLEVEYKNAKVGDNEYISAVIKDADGSISRYTRVVQLDGTTNGTRGRAAIDLTGIDMTGKTLCVFNEQYNGDKNTDCASVLCAVSLTAAPLPAFPAEDLADPMIRIIPHKNGGYPAQSGTRTAADFFQPGKAPEGAKITAVTPPASPSILDGISVDSDGTLNYFKNNAEGIELKTEGYTVTITSDDYAPISAPLTVRQYLYAGSEEDLWVVLWGYGDTYTYTRRATNPGENGVWSATAREQGIFEIYEETTDTTSEPGKSIYTIKVRALKKGTTYIDILYVSDTTASWESGIAGGRVKTRSLAVTARDVSITKGEMLPADLVTCTGLLESEGWTDDRDAVLDNALDYRLLDSDGTEVTADEACNTIGSYTIVPTASLKAGWDERYQLYKQDGTLTVEEKIEEQFTLTSDGTYYFDLSAMGIPGTVNDALPDKTMHYVPFTYAGTVDAYKLTSEKETTEEYAQQNKYPHSLFIANHNVTHTVSWNDLNTSDLIFGKDYAAGGVNYTLRAPSAGSGRTYSDESQRGAPQSNEWDKILDKNDRYIKNWIERYSLGQDTSKNAGMSFRAIRGNSSARYWNNNIPTNFYLSLGFRPVLEVLNPDTLDADGLKAVTLDLGGGKLGDSSENIQIIVKNDSEFTAPASDGLTRPDGNTENYFKWLGSDGTLYAPGESVSADVTKLTAKFAGGSSGSGGGGGSRKPSVTYYTLHFETNGGSAITDMREANNTRISLTKYVPTRHGYTFIGWYSDHNLTNQVSEFSLTKNMTVYAGWRADENPDIVVNPFTDVSEKDWFYNDAMFVYKNGLMLGTSKTLFGPHGTVTRGMMATILWRMEGSLAPKGENSFTDVEAGRWYADAITWTAENGIFAGYSKDKFGPDDPITREQLTAIFYRYADYKGYKLTVTENLDKFEDADKITDYAKMVMQWAVGNGLIKGKSENLLDPQGTATRAEISAMLHRFIEKAKPMQAD